MIFPNVILSAAKNLFGGASLWLVVIEQPQPGRLRHRTAEYAQGDTQSCV